MGFSFLEAGQIVRPFFSRFLVTFVAINFCMEGTQRKNVKPGLEVDIVLKADQRTGRLTNGIVKDILTNSAFHPHGIKVRLTSGQVGRIKEILE